jgi:hypothetical protein
MQRRRKKMLEEHKKIRSEANIKYWDSHRKPRLQKNGYYTICIGNKKKYVHRIVMEEYLGRPIEKHEHVHHINGDKTDNRIENLELIDSREHERYHAIIRGLGHNKKGVSPVNKTSRTTIETIREMRRSGMLLREICESTGLSYPTVQKYSKEVM